VARRLLVGAPSQDELEELHLKPMTRTGTRVLYPDTSISQKYAYYKRLLKMTERSKGRLKTIMHMLL